MLEIDIRPIHTPSERDQLAQLIAAQPQQPTLTVPFMHSVAQHGGMLLGAFEDNNLRGYAFGMIGLVDDAGRIDSIAAARLMLFLERMEIDKAHQNRGLGYELMVGVRLFAVRLGLHFIAGSFDLLDSRQGWLYISKLGAIVGSYGGMVSRVSDPSGSTEHPHKTLPAKLDWWIGNNRVKRRTMQPRKPLKLKAFLQGGGIIINATSGDGAPETFDQIDGTILLVEIPADFGLLRREKPAVADQWCVHIDAVLNHYFANGYFVTDFVYQRDEPEGKRAYYVLAHQDSSLL